MIHFMYAKKLKFLVPLSILLLDLKIDSTKTAQIAYSTFFAFFIDIYLATLIYGMTVSDFCKMLITSAGCYSPTMCNGRNVITRHS